MVLYFTFPSDMHIVLETILRHKYYWKWAKSVAEIEFISPSSVPGGFEGYYAVIWIALSTTGSDGEAKVLYDCIRQYQWRYMKGMSYHWYVLATFHMVGNTTVMKTFNHW